MRARLLLSTLLLAHGLACRGRTPAAASASPAGVSSSASGASSSSSAAPSERDVLLARIRSLDEVAPCLVDAGASAVHIVDAELAGDAATVSFACDNGAAAGKVTFFRLDGTWTISTKEIRGTRPAPSGRDR